MSDIPERIRKVLSTKFCVEEEKLVPEASFKDDLGFDSLDAIELALALEKEFGIEISDDDVEGITTIDDAERFIAKAP